VPSGDVGSPTRGQRVEFRTFTVHSRSCPVRRRTRDIPYLFSAFGGLVPKASRIKAIPRRPRTSSRNRVLVLAPSNRR